MTDSKYNKENKSVEEEVVKQLLIKHNVEFPMPIPDKILDKATYDKIYNSYENIYSRLYLCKGSNVVHRILVDVYRNKLIEIKAAYDQYFCNDCKVNFKTPEEYNSHYLHCNKCPLCEEIIPVKSLVDHFPNKCKHMFKSSCDICDERFINDDVLKIHLENNEKCKQVKKIYDSIKEALKQIVKV